MQMNYNKRRKLNKLKTSLLLLMLALFVLPAKAQTVWMKEGRTELISGQTVEFYDSHGPAERSAALEDESGMRVNYWDKWYVAPEQYTHTFIAPASAPYVKVTFNLYTAYDWSDEGDYQAIPPVAPYNCTPIGEYINGVFVEKKWSLRLNDDVLYVYEGTAVDPTKLIGTYTGNSQTEFSIMAQGAMTFRFVSNDLFREEGWSASVQALTSMAPQAPYMRRSTCSDDIELISTTLGATLYYTTNGNDPTPEDPLNHTQVYDGTPIAWGSDDLEVRAIAVLGTDVSDVARVTFTDDDRLPNINTNDYKPGLERVAGTNKVKITCPSPEAGLNETFVVYYTDGITATGDPTPSNYSMKLIFVNANIDLEDEGEKVHNVHRSRTYEFECTNPSAVFRAKVYGFTCQNLQSPVAGPLNFGNILVDDPEITFVTTNSTQGTGTASITCAFNGAAIYYTTDGSEPDLENVGGTNPTQLYTGSFAVSAGMTVKAKAVVSQTGFTPSNTVSKLFVPTNGQGEPQNGVFGSVVLLDDREDHSWSYYSDGDQPIHSLKPADVKIMYLGNGKMYTSTTATPSGDLSNASGVQVSASETANQFVYLKTLENANPEGSSGTNQSYPYTLIPNPFSKRPTFTSGGTTYYTGFYGWRVKRLAGATIDGHAVGDIISAEEEITIVSGNSQGNEVEFEAVWARAYVVTSNTTSGLQSSVGYERNFVYLSSNTTLRSDGNNNAALSVPVTYTTLDPATGSGTKGTIIIRGGFTCGANTKFENATLEQYNNTNQTFTANNHDLIMGRGLTGTIANIHGIEGAYNGDLNYTLRVESGNYSKMSFVDDRNNGAHVTVSGRVQVKGIMGSDYDRAKNDDDKLHVSNGGTFYFSRDVEYHDPRNKDVETFNCVIKSGSYQEHQWDGTDGNSNNNFYCGPNHGAQASYPGVRNVTIEGGQLANMNGGQGSDDTSLNNETNHASTNVVNFNARIKGGTFHGCVFGGASDNPSNGSKRIVVTGGTIKGWIAGGANGTGTGQSGSTSQTNGNSYIYVGGNSTIGSTNPITINETQGGNIFGAGRGRTTQRASIDISNVVVADNTTVYQNVYGAGYCGYITNTANVFVLGGTVKQNVYGGGYNHNQSVGGVAKIIPTTNIYAKGGEVQGSVYGGSNSSGTVTNSHVTVSGVDAVTNVFGGGLGQSTLIGNNTNVNINGGTINNVYGGGELGTVTGNTHVTVNGGTMQNVYGAGLGATNSWPINAGNANIGGNTEVNINGGTVNESVYGGGENGTVAFATGGATSNHSSTVSMSGGLVKGDVFGGGREGTTQGRTIVNISGGEINNNVFGGAYGIAERVYVAGTHTVNVMGNNAGGYPYIKGCVYGGSRLANDGLDLTLTHSDFNDSNETTLSSVVNISGGRIKEHVYAAGFYGRCFGSCYVNIGSLAIQNGPYNTDDKAFQTSNIFIQGTVWAGGDWGTFAGVFGKATITGNTNIYIDGEGYNTESTTYTDENYMGIGGSVLGCGTSCDAGKANRHFVMRNYGKMKTAGGNETNPVTGTTRDFYSTQLFTKVFIDASHITFKGQGMMNSLNVTERYSLFELTDERDGMTGGVYVLNGSTMVLNAPASHLNTYNSATCANTLVANPQCTILGRDALYNAHLNNQDNKVRVNNGSYIEVKYNIKDIQGNVTDTLYGPVNGYTHMMTSAKTDEATCAYARPKNAVNSPVASTYDNPEDGGFLSYDDYYNVFTQNGTLVTEGNQYELAYENHAPTSKSDTKYFRVWRYGGGIHYVEGIINVNQVGKVGDESTPDYCTVDVTLQLPAWRSEESYYRFDRTEGSPAYTLIDYGTDVITYNAACWGTTPGANNWMYFDGNAQVTTASSSNCPEIAKLTQNPDQNFGLIIMPGSAMQASTGTPSNYIICSSSDSYIAENMQYVCTDYKKMPSVTFRLTYKNNINSNTTWDPVTIPLVQCLADGTPMETVYITLTVSTETDIESTFNTQLYATMVGAGNSAHQRLQGTIVLPTFDTDIHPAQAKFYVESAKFTQGIALTEGSISNYYDVGNPGGSVLYKAHTDNMDVNSFGLTVCAVPTPDIMDDWRQVQPEFDCGPIDNGRTTRWDYTHITPGNEHGDGYLGYAGGRNGLSIGFNLYYSDLPSVPSETLMGTLEISFMFTHYAEDGGDNIGHFKVIIQVYRRGEGSNFYVDGIYGTDDTQVDRGLFPNYAAKSVEFVLSRLGYKPGDNIFIVNTVDIKKPLKWDGSKKQDNVNIWRYPGNHPLKAGIDPIQNNTLNNAFKDVLFNVTQPLTLTSIKVDGIYHEATATEHKLKIFPTTPNPSDEGSIIFDGKADAPLFVINENGAVNLRNSSKLLYNYNGNAGTDENATLGGAVWVKQGGLLTMNENADITGNINANGGGVYMDGGMVVSNYAYVFNNFKAPATSKVDQEQSNVWLTKGYENDKYKVVQIGMENDEAYNQLLTSETANAKIGIDKEYSNDAYKMDDYLPVVYTATSTLEYLDEPYNANRANAGEGIIVHDRAKYKLERYTPTNYLYWLSTWVTFQDHQPNHSIIDGVDEGGWDDINNIHTPQQLAWFISLVNGENGARASDFADKTIIITNDISMDGHVWVPIGTPEHPFRGTFEGNGHVITDMYGSLVQTNMGMFGHTENANIQDAVVSTRFSGTNDDLGTVVGTMTGGTLSNVEGAGSIINKYSEGNMGGLVGNNVGGTIHSCFATADMQGGAYMGGLVGKNTGNLYNSYSNIDYAKLDGQTANMTIGGLAYENTGIIQNCYVVEGSHINGTFNAFAAKNTGSIDYCYAAKGTSNYVGTGTQPTTHGTYDVVLDRKAIGYMYGDNKTEKVGTGTNNYVKSAIAYADGRISTWPGLLSTLNSWVEDGHTSYTKWLRPTSGDINDDLPVLCFPKDNSLATEDGKFLRYGSNVNFNGLDTLLHLTYEQPANMFLYGIAEDVTGGTGDNHLFINEDAVLLQTLAEGATEMAEIEATVGVTFDNSFKSANDFFGTTLAYDWHFFSSPLTAAPMGISYSGSNMAYGQPADIQSMTGNYMPNGLTDQSTVTWDLYSFYEPQYHWINFKRSAGNHWHYDDPHGNIAYTNESSFTKGKGYMMAISQDSYLNNTGTLNTTGFTIPVTAASEAPGLDEHGYNLLGNPYQAYLDMSLFFENANNNSLFENSYWVYIAEGNNYISGNFAASDNVALPSGTLHPHQAFFVKVKEETNSGKDGMVAQFAYDMATAEAQAYSYYRGTKVNYPLVNLFATDAEGKKDLAVVEFNRPEQGGSEKLRALNNANFDLSAAMSGKEYSILFTEEDTEKVPVHFSTRVDGTFTLTWETMHGNFTSLLLVDNMTGTITDMLRSDYYTFDASNEDYASRFYLTYTVTDVDEYNVGDGSFAYFDGSEWVVDGKGQLDVIDVMGRVLFSKRLANEQNRVSLNGVANGVYLMRVSDGKNTMVQKIVVK